MTSPKRHTTLHWENAETLGPVTENARTAPLRPTLDPAVATHPHQLRTDRPHLQIANGPHQPSAILDVTPYGEPLAEDVVLDRGAASAKPRPDRLTWEGRTVAVEKPEDTPDYQNSMQLTSERVPPVVSAAKRIGQGGDPEGRVAKKGVVRARATAVLPRSETKPHDVTVHWADMGDTPAPEDFPVTSPPVVEREYVPGYNEAPPTPKPKPIKEAEAPELQSTSRPRAAKMANVALAVAALLGAYLVYQGTSTF
jgi:hypothetical protein